jgi:transcriptional regulator with XRE-family HTH domain
MRKKRVRDPLDADVGHRVRIHRTARRMSQSELAHRLGITFQQVQKYEKGANRVGAGRLMRIAKILDVPVVSLLGDGTAAPQSQAAPAATNVLACLSQLGAVRLVQAYARVPPGELRTTIVELIERIADKTEND